MPASYFMGDLHLNHKRILEFRTGYGNTVEEHDEIILDKINSTVRPKDKLYIVGDAAFGREGAEKLSRILCRNIDLVMGNHDNQYTIPYFNKIYGLCANFKDFWLQHAPIHERSLRGIYCVHGHTHYKSVEDSRYLCVSVEQCDGIPMSIDQVRERLEDQNSYHGS